jgi:hypothetical protein
MLGALALTGFVAAPGATAAAEVEEVTSFAAPCILGPGILNLEASATITARADHPAEVRSGEEFQFNGASIVVKLPPEQSEQFHALGATTVNGTITNFPATVIYGSPASLNLADSATFSAGLPFAAPVEAGRELVLTGPSEGRTSIWGPLTVTGNPGENVTLTTSPGAAFQESETGFKATGNGIVASISGYNAEGGKVIGPLKLVCTPSEDLLASVPIPITGPPPPPPPVEAPNITSIAPASGPSGGGTTVTITGSYFNNVSAVEFAGTKASSFTVDSPNSITAVSPSHSVAGPGALIAIVTVTTPAGTSPISYNSNDEFSYTNPNRPVAEQLTFAKWTLAGTLTPKPLAQAIALPSGSSFNGGGELNTETNQGSISGSISIPAFKASPKLFGFIPATLGMTATQVGALSGSIAPSKTVSGDDTLTLPLQLKLGFTSLGLFGLNIPTTCATSTPVSLTLVENLSREALASRGFSVSGTATLPKITCQGGLLGALYGEVISGLISGTGATYALSVTPPGS